MDPQRPSTSKNQANLKTGASRSKLEKELKEILDLAKNIKEESTFQKEHRYRKFKAKNHTIAAHEIGPFGIWTIFFDGLNMLDFHEESIYWCSKILEDVRLCDSPERLYALYIIAKSFYGLEDFENAFKYGEKNREISLQTMTTEDRDRRKCLLLMMENASRKLDIIDEFQYPREILKLSVSMYNAKEMDKSELLESYMSLIEMQTEIGEFKDAKKTLKHLKLFSLNSWNSSEVMKSMENEGYGQIVSCDNFWPRTHAHSHTRFSAARTSHALVHFAKI